VGIGDMSTRKEDEMKYARPIGAALAVFMLGVFFASTASALTFLLAEWLEAGAAISSAKLVDGEGEINIVNLDGGGLGVTIELLCSGIGVGTVGPASEGTTTAFLNLAGEEISGVPLTGLALECTNSKNCTEPLVWAEELPWKGELELMEDGTEILFVGLGFKGAMYSECLVAGISVSELCTVAVAAGELTNEAGGTVDGVASDAFQELAGLKLGECAGHAEVAEVSGLGLLLLTSGNALTVSSGT
jgi:hypothetical protein